ncbi:sulfurtransferase [Pusillimonas sp. CC-YST705]|uniref:Sulfurtransferase n=1 Tax=Mesopusillimonas faecipullorum TaxID=2755040 RepID=A0ABS8CAP3_9BURK|nr:sulfurtransferase [Mesopusillimonas faecipullorum]MCB5363100.1 sulfurtransferase [Mesopusillimonas faecipullorum]
MSVSPLISAEQLQDLLRQPSLHVLLIDCRYVLTDPAAGAQAYAQGHILGAVYADLGEILSGPANQTGLGGRHPLPDPQRFAKDMAALGVSQSTLVVAYDTGESVFASRLWWLMRWIGHEAVCVLDGGLQAWLKAGGELSSQTPQPTPGALSVHQPSRPTVGFEQVLGNVSDSKLQVLDARSPDRFRGENETMDPVGGHIPGALNRHYKDNLDADGRFKTPSQLRAEFQALLGDRPAHQLVHQCGSGVSACHNLLAMEVAGLYGSALYPGSWSEWCRQPGAPIEGS